MNRFAYAGLAVAVAAFALTSVSGADARSRRKAPASETGGVPYLDVKGSCMEAQKFSSTDDKNLAFNGCMQDETNAKADLVKRWSTFKGKDRSNCVEQARFPSPSYVEVLTCLEMSSNNMQAGPRFNGSPPVPQIGGPVAPGLSTSPAPGGKAAPPPTAPVGKPQ